MDKHSIQIIAEVGKVLKCEFSWLGYSTWTTGLHERPGETWYTRDLIPVVPTASTKFQPFGCFRR